MDEITGITSGEVLGGVLMGGLLVVWVVGASCPTGLHMTIHTETGNVLISGTFSPVPGTATA